MFKESFKAVSRNFQECLKIVSRKFQGYFKRFQGYFKDVERLRVFQGGFNGVLLTKIFMIDLLVSIILTRQI